LWLYEIQNPPLDLNRKQVIQFVLPNPFSLVNILNTFLICPVCAIPFHLP